MRNIPRLLWGKLRLRGGSMEPAATEERTRQRNLLRRFWRTAALFWTGGSRAAAWRLSAGLLSVIILLVGAAYAMNTWNREMFDSLQNRNVDAVARLSIIYFVILIVSVAFGVFQVYLRMTLQRSWRAWLNDQLVDRCDILVGMFWTKLGTSTGVAASGTVEEIDRFVAAGKPAMLYFSRRKSSGTESIRSRPRSL